MLAASVSSSLDAILEAYLERLTRRGHSPCTITGYRNTISRFLRDLPHLLIDQITTEHVERHLDSLGVGAHSHNIYAARLFTFFKHLSKTGLIRKNPIRNAVLPRWRPVFRPAPSQSEFQGILKACRDQNDRLLVNILFYTGLRIAELRSVRVGDVDLGLRRIRVLGKGRRERVVIFPSSLVEPLEDHLLRQGGSKDDYLLRTEPPFQGRWSLKRINGGLRRIGKEARLPYKLTAHVLRHGFFRMCKERGMPIDAAAKLGGNSPQMVLEIYGQFDIDDIQGLYDERIPK